MRPARTDGNVTRLKAGSFDVGALHGRGGAGVPVLDESRAAIVGWVRYENVLARMHLGADRGGTETRR